MTDRIMNHAMNFKTHECVYPIVISTETPEIIRLTLLDHGLPAIRSKSDDLDTMRSKSRPSILIHDRKFAKEAAEFSARLTIAWQDLLPAGSSLLDLSEESSRPERRTWQENGVELSENIVEDTTAEGVVSSLKRLVLQAGLPWIRLAPWPWGYSGVFNFRIDIDEPEPNDWRRVFDVLEKSSLSQSSTWFLSTKATESSPEIYRWLAHQDVQSHGHWHHVHSNDSRLNERNLELADRILRDRSFCPTGFAAPCGRISPDLAPILRRLNYRYLAGIGGVNGSEPRRLPDGLWRIDSLPVSEGLYLENGIDDDETIIAGYRSVADRAISHDRPLFWYGHAERRWGRKPGLLRSILESATQLGRFWFVSLGHYLDWLASRDSCRLRVIRYDDHPDRLELRWNGNGQGPANMIWLEDRENRWKLECRLGVHQTPFRFDTSKASPLVKPASEPCSRALLPSGNSLRSRIRTILDWERESPVDQLRNGPPTRRLKRFLRQTTDSAWRRRFCPTAWPETRSAEKRST